ncbi:unnamed protein product [Lactuca virosa]|uniref:tRNA nucleotidyltransferase/poly(A) polymerase RNA and SrmB- binding domain-containing protein n=1 Tax=Lactuca virosa TaxID=75947 RepID=A0AAU9PDK8_9ASTR|nr:unnamed protein product [Lactuca virosa]
MDPLRVLRAIRFSTRLEFEMGEEVKVAAGDNDVKSAIVGKVSRERIWHEIHLMLSGNQPAKALGYLSDFGLFWVVFTPPSNCKPLILKEDNKDKIYKQKRVYLYASLLLPLWKTVYIDNKKKTAPVVTYIINTSDGDEVMRLYDAVDKFLCLIPLILFGEDMEIPWETDIIEVSVASKTRILLGLLLREIKGLWRAALMMSTFLFKNTAVEGLLGGERREVFMKVEQEILRLGLEKVWEMKALVNGKDIMRHLGVEKGGPAVGKWQRRLLQLQLANPSCGSVKECLDWMTEQMKLE